MGDDCWDEETAPHRYSPNPAPTGELDHLSLEDRGILLECGQDYSEDRSSVGPKHSEADQRYVSCLHMLHAVTLCHDTLALCIVTMTLVNCCNNTSHMYDVAGDGKSVVPFSVHLVLHARHPMWGGRLRRGAERG